MEPQISLLHPENVVSHLALESVSKTSRLRHKSIHISTPQLEKAVENSIRILLKIKVYTNAGRVKGNAVPASRFVCSACHPLGRRTRFCHVLRIAMSTMS
jgi:hypothetical protein